MSSVIGTCRNTGSKGWWEVHSDGKAYGDDGQVLYRWADGTWRKKLVRTVVGGSPVFQSEDSERIESLYRRYVAGIILSPVDRSGGHR